MTPRFRAAAHHPPERHPQDPPPGRVLPGAPQEDPIPPEMLPERDLPGLPQPEPLSEPG